MRNAKNSDDNKVVGANEFVTEAYSAKSDDELKEFYTKWAADYDNQMTQNLNYISPKIITQHLQIHLPEKDSKILDIGCGTGLTANEMHVAGYTNLYGIDLSKDMVNVADARGIYNGLVVADINLSLEYANSSFDGAISSGTFTHGHVGPEPLEEIFRTLKPQGVLACTVHQDLWVERGFELAFQNLVDNNQAKCLSREFGSYYKDAPEEGWFCVYQKP